VSDYDGLSLFQRIEQTDNVTYKVEERKLIYGFRALRLTIAAHIGRDSMEARLGERGELMAPRIPRFWESVAHDHERPAARFDKVHIDAIGADGAMPKLHAVLLQAALLYVRFS